MMHLPYPNITATDPRGQVEQMKSYLHQMVDKLNYTLDQLEKEKKEG